jgi:molybdopterin-containing oxidoreductase family iron-sulfur binding subunit
MDFSAIRSRLAGADGRLYWRSLGELADTPEFREYLHREFPAQASEWNDPKGRRDFLKLMSASLALAGVGACTRQPPENIVPYVRQPEQLVPGRPLFFATAVPVSGVAHPVLVESHMGRPTKIEGNPEHPASLGATDAITQAAILDLYDPDRARTVTDRGQVSSWNALSAALQMPLAGVRGAQGAGLRFLTGPITSPSLAQLMATVLQTYPQARWHQYDPVAHAPAPDSGAPLYQFDKADVILSLDADFLGCGPASVRYSHDFAGRRRVTDEQKAMSRLYAVESTPTLTGAKADHRLPMRAADVEGFAAAIAAAAGVAAGAGPAAAPSQESSPELTRWIAAVSKDLQAHRGRSVVVAGDFQSPAVHAMARAMNQALGNVGATVTYGGAIEAQPVDYLASLAELASALEAGQVQVLVILGVNAAYTAPADLRFTEKLAKVPFSLYHGLHADETAFLCHWHAPDTHPLETWGDTRAYDGTVTLMQPLISPLYDGRSAHEILSLFSSQPGRRSLDIVKDYWTRAFNGEGGWAIRDASGQPFASADAFWARAVHDGFIPGTAISAGGPATPFGEAAPAGAAPAEAGAAAAGAAAAGAATDQPAAPAPAAEPSGPPAAAPSAQPPATGLELIFRPDPAVWDGRFANNGWLQELPKPLTKLTWDTAAWVSPALAAERQLRNGDIVELRYRGSNVRFPVLVVPGQPHQSVTVFFGYGRTRAGRVGTASEQARQFNAFLLRTSDAPWFGGGLELVKTGERYALATTQEHHLMEGRNTVRVATLAQYTSEPSIIQHMGHTPPRTMTLYPEKEYDGYKWGMAIDVTSCTGCSACIVACVAENNIPVVGKDQVSRGREMHWLRVDSYFSAERDDVEALENPQTYFQPVPCMQCEKAPCEVVCPVAATTHSAEGLNDMVYNRCVGTRYCSNNCPYKVRRFNFLLYSDWNTQSLEPLRNPDVTVRSRGVMEKCTYCVQRINQARIDAKREDRPIRDGEILTACQSVCPTQAIVFGDLNNPESQVSRLKAQQRNYGLLEELNTRPRTTYLAALRNPNPELEPEGAQRPTTGH